MSLCACVMVSPYGYCYLPADTRYVISDCSIQESFITNGVVTNIYEYIDYLNSHGWNIQDAELHHDKQVKSEIEQYKKRGAAWAHEQSVLREPHRYYFEKENLYEPVRFIEYEKIYSCI